MQPFLILKIKAIFEWVKSSIYNIWLFIYLVAWGGNFQVRAQKPSVDPGIKQAFARAEKLMNSFQNDSAAGILITLKNELAVSKELNSFLGLKVQLRLAEALEKDHKNEIAIQQLLHVLEASNKNEAWSVLTDAHLSLARLHEKMARWPSCLENLESAKTVIQGNQLDSLYPRYAIRMSSYHRLHGDRDTAIFFAQEVVRTAPLYQYDDHTATGHLLMGMLIDRSEHEKIIKHYLEAGEHWKKSGDFTGYGAILGNLATLHLKINKPQIALSYNDKSLKAYTKAASMGNEAPWLFYNTYHKRAEIFEKLGLLDSALFYSKKGYEMELNNAYQSNHEKVIEIDAQYKDEKKVQRIAQQALQIKFEKVRRNELYGFITIVLLFAGMLTYYYLRLRKANQKTEVQALEIDKTNKDLSVSLQQQLVLQGEVHHRVKNNLQVIMSLIELQKEEIKDPVAIKNIDAMSNRIYSMAAIHEMLYQREGSELVSLHQYTEKLCRHFSNFSTEQDKPTFDLDLGNKYFNLETLMPLGIILNELLTNSLKYAHTIGKKLTIHIDLKPVGSGYCMHYRDNGPGFPTGVLRDREGGLGTYLLTSMSRQLQGHFESKNDNGAVCNVFFKEKNNGKG